ncbi:MAG: hypothetical protein J5678_05720 [Bacteroidaceae bacterium]|nr:hypothetical protein [Bacteroidaceae bacterium]
MIEYNVYLNNGIEAFGIDQKTITANEEVKTVDEVALAREINHENPLIPEQLAKSVLENFCKAAANLMAMGFAIQFRNGNDVVMRIYPDIHIKGGNINLERAKKLDSNVTELTTENAGELVSKAGVTLRAKAECEQKFTDLLLTVGPSLQRNEVIERAKVMRSTSYNGNPSDDGGNTSGGGGFQGNPDDDTQGGGSGGGTTTTSVATPVISDDANITANGTVHVTCATDGATMYYTVGMDSDPTDPTNQSTAVPANGTIVANESYSQDAHLKVIAYKDGVYSTVASKTIPARQDD